MDFVERSEFEEKITALEIKSAYIEDFVDQLQQSVVEQSAVIEILKKENRFLREKLKDVSSLLEGDITEKKPPHY